MRPYFEKMADFGTALKKGQIKRGEENAALLKQVETQVAAAAEGIKQLGLPEEKVNARGEMTLWQRLNYLVDADTWHPLHTLFNPLDNEEGTTNVVDGIGRISGKWAVIIGFDNKVMAGAWLAGQSENILRVTDLAKRLNVPLVWLVNCSGAKLSEQHKFYANRRGAGAPFYRHAQLNQMGIPVLAAIFGTNPAGGGYQAISPTVLFAHKECNIAVGGAGIVSGMAPKGGFDTASAQELIENTRQFKSHPPGSAQIHYNQTGFFRYLYEEEEGVLDGLKSYMRNMPAYDPEFFRVAAPCAPKFATDELYTLLPIDQKKVYAFDEILARLVDGSEHMAFRPDYGPEIYTGLCKMDGYLVACIGNRQGYLGKDYPEYAEYPGMGGKLYRQGMLKMNEFVILCARDRIPIIWLQDTSGIDVGDAAEKAELLAIGQSLIYSIESSDVPQMLVLLRKGSAAAHYLMGGPQGNSTNAFSIGTAATEVYVMHGETAAVAMYARRLVKEEDSCKPLEPIIEKMNQIVADYKEFSRPQYCAKLGYVDEIVDLGALRRYMTAFAGCAYQNPKSICPQHHMVLPRIIKG
ncbi:MAG: glutaconyl-CoA decarboxylase subunit alpha [Desulfatitalea sp. BRH_c12]|nr:MAG: glutaconyl-CoA decarboxylase subunit alpha [Desulfatitalea sp. BRH_c12]